MLSVDTKEALKGLIRKPQDYLDPVPHDTSFSKKTEKFSSLVLGR